VNIPQPPKSLIPQFLSNEEDSERFSKTSSVSQEACYQIIEPQSEKVWGFVSINNTQRGPGLGGIRMAQNVTLNEVRR